MLQEKVEKDWQKFEKLVAKIHDQFYPDWDVVRNARVTGSVGIKRDIDILITSKVKPDIRIGIECKDHKQRLDIKDIEAIHGLFEDAGITQGIIVAAQGFSKAALSKCEQKGITPYRLVDTDDHKWKIKAAIPAVLTITHLKWREFHIATTGAFPPVEDAFLFEIFDITGIRLGTGKELFDQTRLGIILKEQSIEKIITFKLIDSQQHYVMSQGNKYCLDVTVNAALEKAHYYGQLPLEKISGFQNQFDAAVRAKAFEFKISTDDMSEILHSWEKISDETLNNAGRQYIIRAALDLI